MKIIELRRDLSDIPATLRNLADEIEAGDYGTVVALAWVLDAEHANVEYGVIGQLSSPDATFIALCELGKHRIMGMMGK